MTCFSAGVPVETRWGTFQLTATQRGLYSLEFPMAEALRKEAGDVHEQALMPVPEFMPEAERRLREYFEGKEVSFDGLPFDLEGLRPFSREILTVLTRSRRGERLTYGSLASKAGFAGRARAVGQVMRRNRLPIVIPCHRVFSSDGSLGGYTPGQEWKERLLRLESHDRGGAEVL